MRWIIGDIHGMLRPLELLLSEIDKRDSAAELIFCGDFVNRGPDSRGVVDVLLSRTTARFCRGNHDDTFDLLLNGKCFVPHAQMGGAISTFEHFMKFGLAETLLSYGLDWANIDHVHRHPSPEALALLLDPVPQAHRDFFRKLPAIQEETEFFVGHAKWDPDEFAGVPSFKAQINRSIKHRHDIIWGRYTAAEINQTKPWDRVGFFGHTPVTMYRRSDEITPIVGDKLVLLDTAAAINPEGRLTAWCFEEERFIQADRSGEKIRG
jgi:serine/threonine protein phosphatase 1